MPKALPITAPALLALCLGSLSAPSAAQAETAFTYQGELKINGDLAEGLFDMDFSLWDAASGGTQVGTLLEAGDVPVVDGRFTVELDFGAGVFDNTGRWLEIEVEGFTLFPRTPITRSPYSIQTRGIYVDENERVGIGTQSPQDELHVVGSQATLRLEDDDDPNSFTEVKDAQPTQLRINKVNSSGNTYLDLNPKAANGISNALVRFFRETDTTGTKGLRLYRGNNTTQLSASVGVDGRNSFFQAHGGYLGVGTNTPQAALDVVGDSLFRNRLAIGGDPGFQFGQLTIADSGDGAIFAIDARSSNDAYPTISAINGGAGPALWASGTSDAAPGGGGLIVAGAEAGRNVVIDDNEIMARDGGAPSTLHLNADGGEINMGANDIHPAYAYARVAANGTILKASPNVLDVEHIGSGQYNVYLAGERRDDDVMIVSGSKPFTVIFFIDWISVGAWDDRPGEFSIVVYRP